MTTRKETERVDERVQHLTKLLPPSSSSSKWNYLDLGYGDTKITIKVAEEYDLSLNSVIYSNITSTKEIKDNDTEMIFIPVEGNRINVHDHYVNLVTCFMTISHFGDHKVLLSEISRVMASGGYLFIREHDVNPLNTQLIKYLDDRREKYSDQPEGTKSNYCTRDGLRKKLEKMGFKHISDSDYQKGIGNPQKIYHSLFRAPVIAMKK